MLLAGCKYSCRSYANAEVNDAWEADDDTPYFQQGAELPPREEWEIAAPIDFSDFQGTLQISHQLDALFLSEKEIETPLGMDDTQQNWKWADAGSRRMPRSPLTHPTLMVDDENGIRRPAVSQVHHKTLFQWIVDNLSWLSQYMTLSMSWTTVRYQEPILLSTGRISHHGSKGDVKSLGLTKRKQLLSIFHQL